MASTRSRGPSRAARARGGRPLASLSRRRGEVRDGQARAVVIALQGGRDGLLQCALPRSRSRPRTAAPRPRCGREPAPTPPRAALRSPARRCRRDASPRGPRGPGRCGPPAGTGCPPPLRRREGRQRRSPTREAGSWPAAYGGPPVTDASAKAAPRAPTGAAVWRTGAGRDVGASIRGRRGRARGSGARPARPRRPRRGRRRRGHSGDPRGRPPPPPSATRASTARLPRSASGVRGCVAAIGRRATPSLISPRAHEPHRRPMRHVGDPSSGARP